MKELSGFNQTKKQMNIDISTCIIRCEKRIYGTITLNLKMGNDSELNSLGYSNNWYSDKMIKDLRKGRN